MYRVSVSNLQPGMRVGRSVVDATGRILLTAGTVVKQSYINYLKQRGIPAVYVINELAPDVTPPEVISERTRQQAVSNLGTAVQELRELIDSKGVSAIRHWSGASFNKVRSAVSALVEEVLRNPNAVLHLQEIRAHDEYTLQHSVDVGVLSLLMGVSLGFNVSQLRDLGLGAVLHDVGKVAISEAILKKPGPLTAEEMQEMQQHTTRGFEILMQQSEFSYHVAHVAYQHHERWGGGGYPRGLKGGEIHELARIVAVADVYDAMTSDRVYRPGYPPDRAIRNMLEVIPDWFEPRMLATLVDHIALFPVGTLVELNTGETAVVTEVVKGQGTRPKVRVIKDPTGAVVPSPWEIDLARETTYRIARTLAEAPSPMTRENVDQSGVTE